VAAKKPPAAQQPDDLGRLLPTKEAAPLVGQSEEALRQWRHRGYGPKSFKSGRKLVWPEVWLLAWRKEQQAKTTRGGGG
jgi:hypothetical protein